MALWTLAGSGDWTNAANWSGGVPNAVGAQADFVLTGSGALREISFDGNTPVSVGTLNVTISGSQGLWFHGSIADGGAGAGKLIFDCTAVDQYALVTINTAVGGGEFEISNFGELGVQLNDDTRFDVVNAGTIARINTSIAGSSSAQLQKAGAGTLQLGVFDNSALTGGILIDGGTLDALDAMALGSGNIFIRNNSMLVSDGALASNIATFSGQLGTAGSAKIAAHTGTTLTLTGQLKHDAGGTMTFGTATHNGTIVLNNSLGSSINTASTIVIDHGTVRLGNSTLANNLLDRGGIGTGTTSISSGATLDTGGFITKIANLDLNGGTILASSGPLSLTVSDRIGAAPLLTGTIVGTADSDNVTFNTSAGGNVNISTLVFSNWGTGALIDRIRVNGGVDANSLTGSSKDDDIYGLGGNDTLRGNGGGDFLDGGDNDDLLIITGLNDGSQVLGGLGTDTLRLTDGTVSLQTVTGFEAIELQNGATLQLTNAQFTNGFTLFSTVSGTGTIQVDASGGVGTTQSVVAKGKVVQAGSNITFVLNGAASNDAIKGADGAVNIITDNAGGTNTLKGGNLGDTITGGSGIDKVTGNAGVDVMSGGAGADIFKFRDMSDSGTGANADVILDYLAGTDRLNFGRIDANPNAAGDQAFTWRGTDAFLTDGTAQLRWVDLGADLRVEVDMNGDGAADMHVLLMGAGAQVLSIADFVL